MKLSEQYNRASIIITLGILLFAGVFYYAVISYISNNELDRDLTEEFDELKQYVSNYKKLPTPVDFDEDVASFTPIGKLIIPKHFVDTPFVERSSKKSEEGRAIVGTVDIKGINYKVTIAESKEATQYLVQTIGFITIALTALLLTALFFTNRYILNGLWKPFYDLLSRLKSFSIAKSPAYSPKSVAIKADEFRELQEAMDTMAVKARNDYQNLKIFTENASHEMMTPLAVIASKLDTLIQDENLNKEQLEQLYSINLTIGKLSKLSQSLLLLIKIDNRQVNDNDVIDLSLLIDEKLQHFQEIITGKDIQVNIKLTEKKIHMSQYLVEVLLNNLISNAIRHNFKGGQINVTLAGHELVIENTGPEQALDESGIFERFEKSKSSEGMGLGLTIARNICTSYAFQLSYSFQKPFHRFKVRF